MQGIASPAPDARANTLTATATSPPAESRGHWPAQVTCYVIVMVQTYTPSFWLEVGLFSILKLQYRVGTCSYPSFAVVDAKWSAGVLTLRVGQDRQDTTPPPPVWYYLGKKSVCLD